MYFSLFLYVLIKTSKQNYAFSYFKTENIWSFSGRFCIDTTQTDIIFSIKTRNYIKKQCYGLTLHNTATYIYYN